MVFFYGFGEVIYLLIYDAVMFIFALYRHTDGKDRIRIV